MRIKIGPKLKAIRKQLRVTQEKLATISDISVKTIYHIEKDNRPINIRSFIKIRDALKEHFQFDLEKETVIKIVWHIEDLSKDALSIIVGSLLGNGHIAKNGTYSQVAKDERYLKWLSKLLKKEGILSTVSLVKKRETIYSHNYYYSLYTQYCPALLELRKKWYKNHKGKITKRVPKGIQINRLVLLHWYLGDGTFKRDYRNKKYGRPCIRLCTNAFAEEDIELLIKKLNNLGLRFYKEKINNENKEKRYILSLFVDDMINFFKIIGYKPIPELKNCVTREVYNKQSTLGDKWPNENDWSKILAKTREVLGGIIKEKRKILNLSQRELGEKVNLTKHHISEIENGRKRTSLKRFDAFIRVLNLNMEDTLNNYIY